MKKNIIFAAFAAASALLLVSSCAKEQLRENISAGDGKVFSAVINQDLTKTTITDEYKVNWDQGDLIDISGGATYSATPDASDATKATFTKVSGLDPTPDYIAVYPASIFKNGRHELPATQTYAAGKFNAPMCAISETESLEFKNFCGVLCFALKGTDKVKSIAVTANEQLCGPFEFSTDATFGSFSGENEGYTVTLDCGEGVQLNETTATNFYVYLPPKDSYTAGMKIVVTDTDGETFEKTTTKSATIARNQIYTFNWTASFSPAGEFLTNAEIIKSISDAYKTSGKNGYVEYTIKSASGDWQANANVADALKFLQLQNKKYSHLLSPEFSGNITKIELVINKTTVKRNFYALPVSTELTEANYTNTIFDTAYGSATCEKSKEQTITIVFNKNTKRFKLIVADGTAYIDAIKVYHN